MRNSATILATIALGAMLVTGTTTASMARDGGHGGGHGRGDHSSMGGRGDHDHHRGGRSLGRFGHDFDGHGFRDHDRLGHAIGERAGHDLGDDPWQSSPYYHGTYNPFLFGLFRR